MKVISNAFRLYSLAAFILLIAGVSPARCSTRYFKERNHSVITTGVADNVRTIIAVGASKGRHAARFIKIGDSITASDADSHATPNGYFLCQFVCPDYTASSQAWDYTRNLDTYKSALSPALLYFLTDTMPDGAASFNRSSAAAKVSMTADWATSGSPSPLRKEIDAVSPQFAVIMYGANDAGGYGTLYNILGPYMRNMRKIVDSCIASGIVPILTATCPKLDKMDVTLAMCHLIRCLAQQYQTPFIDYHRAMMPLPNRGLGSDGVHPTTMDYNKHCWLTPEGLKYGYNMRNLLTLQALDRVYRIATTTAASLDPEPPALAGTGSSDDPFVIDSIAFVDAQSTASSRPDIYYRLTLPDACKVRTLVTYQGTTDIDISLLSSSLSVITSAASEPLIDRDLGAGTYYVKLSTNGANYGDYQFVLMDRDNDGSPAKTAVTRAPIRLSPSVKSFKAVPAPSGVVFSVPGQGKLSIVTVQGKRVLWKAQPGRGITVIRWKAPMPGIYLINYSCNTGETVRKLIVR
jgi:hypothetical protein